MSNEQEVRQYYLKIAQKVAEAKTRIEIVGIKKAEGLIKKRIFNRGLAADGSGIGSEYSKKSYAFAMEDFFKQSVFKAQGKNGKSKTTDVFSIATHKKHKVAIKGNHTERLSMYLKEGYKELREIQGLQTAKVDLQYSGDLLDSVQLNSRADVPELGIYNSNEAKIADKLEKQYGKAIFSPATDEREQTIQAMKNEIKIVIDKILKR